MNVVNGLILLKNSIFAQIGKFLDDTGKANRDIVAAKMATADIRKALYMAKECLVSNYKNCGF